MKAMDQDHQNLVKRVTEAALKAVRTWRFVPAQKAGNTVSGALDVPVRFRFTE